MNLYLLKAALRSAAVVAGAHALVATAPAAADSYTDSAAFFSALTANGLTPSTETFESTSAGTVISEGGSVGALGFENFGLMSASNLQIEDTYAATSGNNYLGTDSDANANLLLGGDTFELTLLNSFAIGMFIITAEEPNVSLFDGDVWLTAGGGTALLDVDAVDQVLSPTDRVFFLGVIDPMASFTSASIGYDPSAFLAIAYSIDDITTAVPEPSGMVLLTFAGLGLLAGRRRQRP